ncbi:hypothetical protein POTOM_013415 [Populus tomentosa]|uniref:Sugar phosphate transporter domain-containing protein n=1 Tax=Populus tomentosa TaxID=118781 RepID=A0A8X8A0A3_POPTO|nr:hypothetical protein POTOM_013415 [Populus tomentosa]
MLWLVGLGFNTNNQARSLRMVEAQTWAARRISNPRIMDGTTGATTPFFTAIFAFLITCNKELAEVYCAPLPVVFGIVLASNSEHLFHLFGFLVCVGSTAGRALKSVVQGILLASEAERLHSRRELTKPANHFFIPSLQLHDYRVLQEASTVDKAKVKSPLESINAAALIHQGIQEKR